MMPMMGPRAPNVTTRLSLKSTPTTCLAIRCCVLGRVVHRRELQQGIWGPEVGDGSLFEIEQKPTAGEKHRDSPLEIEVNSISYVVLF